MIVFLHPSQADLARHFEGHEVRYTEPLPIPNGRRTRAKRKQVAWLPAEDQVVRDSVAKRLTAAEIGKMLCRTRNSVIARSNRLGLAWHLSAAEVSFYKRRAQRLSRKARDRNRSLRQLVAST